MNSKNNIYCENVNSITLLQIAFLASKKGLFLAKISCFSLFQIVTI